MQIQNFSWKGFTIADVSKHIFLCASTFHTNISSSQKCLFIMEKIKRCIYMQLTETSHKVYCSPWWLFWFNGFIIHLLQCKYLHESECYMGNYNQETWSWCDKPSTCKRHEKIGACRNFLSSYLKSLHFIQKSYKDVTSIIYKLFLHQWFSNWALYYKESLNVEVLDRQLLRVQRRKLFPKPGKKY